MSIKILSWNIMCGGFESYGNAEDKPPRIDALVDVIKEIKPDILSLIDTYRWTEIFSADELKQIFGYSHVLSVKLEDERLKVLGHDNGITVFSQIPDTRIEAIRLVTRNAIRLSTSEMDVFSIYLDDLSEDARVEQVESLLKLISFNKLTLITGDLNTIDRDDLIQTQKELEKLALKFPEQMKSMESPLDEMKRGELTKLLFDNGLIDLGKDTGNTFPAKLFPLPIEEPVLRLDYGFGNSLIKTEEFKVLTDPKYAYLSDHLPIMIKVNNVNL